MDETEIEGGMTLTYIPPADTALTAANFAALVERVAALEMIVGSLDPGESELPAARNLVSPKSADDKKK